MLRLVLAIAFVHFASAQLGPCIGGECPDGFGCLSGICYESIGPCIGGSCPIGTCIGAVDGMGGECLQTSVTTTTVTTTTAAVTTTTSACVDLAAPGRPSDCPASAYLCNNPLYYNLMTQQCPVTCGRCPTSGTGTTTTAAPCVDLAEPGRPSDCPYRYYLCNNYLYYELMTQQCPKTCGRCSSTSTVTTTPATIISCVDKVGPYGYSECPFKAYLCRSLLYYGLMTYQCPRTCGRC